jgi:hypothetical protein
MVQVYNRASQIIGKGFHKSVPARIKYILDRAAAKQKLDHVSLTDRNRIITAVTKVLTKDGKAAKSVSLSKLQKILNRCQAVSGNYVDKDEINSVERALNITKKVTTKIDTELPVILRAEKKAAAKAKLEKKLGIDSKNSPKGKEKIDYHQRNLDLKADLVKRREAMQSAAEGNNRVVNKDTAKDGAKNGSTSGSATGKPSGAQDSNANAKGPKKPVSKGISRAETTTMRPINKYTLSSFNKQDRADWVNGGVSATDLEKYKIMQDALRRPAWNPNSVNGAVRTEIIPENLNTDASIEKMPDISERWTAADKLAAMGPTDKIKSGDSSGSEETLTPPAPPAVEASNDDIDD